MPDAWKNLEVESKIAGENKIGGPEVAGHVPGPVMYVSGPDEPARVPLPYLSKLHAVGVHKNKNFTSALNGEINTRRCDMYRRPVFISPLYVIGKLC